MKKLFIFLILVIASFSYLQSQPSGQGRIAVLPFENAHGNMDYNVWCYDLQDSLAKYLQKRDPNEYNYRIVPIDSIEALLAEMNIDPANPQYASDLWKAVEKLNCQRVITGNFIVEGNKILINAYIYIPELQLADPNFQVKNIFKDTTDVLSAVEPIGKRLRPGILKIE